MTRRMGLAFPVAPGLVDVGMACLGGSAPGTSTPTAPASAVLPHLLDFSSPSELRNRGEGVTGSPQKPQEENAL